MICAHHQLYKIDVTGGLCCRHELFEKPTQRHRHGARIDPEADSEGLCQGGHLLQVTQRADHHTDAEVHGRYKVAQKIGVVFCREPKFKPPPQLIFTDGQFLGWVRRLAQPLLGHRGHNGLRDHRTALRSRHEGHQEQPKIIEYF